MSHYFENEDLWKLPDYDKADWQSLSEIKKSVQDKTISTEELTLATAEASRLYCKNPDKKSAEEVMEILNLAVEHPNAGVAGGTNEDLDPHKFSQYYEVDSDTEARNLATLVIHLHPDMEKDVFDFYKKLSENYMPVYHDLAKISQEHPKAMDLFEELYNRDLNLYNENYNNNNAIKECCTNSLFRAEQAMENFVSSDNVDRIEKMVNAYRTKENGRLDLIKGKIDAYHTKKLENSLTDKEEDAYINLEHRYKIEKKYSGRYGQGPLREKISQMKAKAATIEEHKKEGSKKEDTSIDTLAAKMDFIEKRVSFVKKNSNLVSREQEDKIRISAYKDFKAQIKE